MIPFPLDYSGRLLSYIYVRLSGTENVGFDGEYKNKKRIVVDFAPSSEVGGYCCCRREREREKKGNGKLKEITDRKNNSRS